ncbi:hypothetical protein Tco_1506188 [Tanacetum coccineum]
MPVRRLGLLCLKEMLALTAKDMCNTREANLLSLQPLAQLMNALERNNMNFPTVTINTKFLNSLQSEWLKYVTQVRLAKQLTVDLFDDLFDYLQHTHGSSSRQTSSYYVTHPTSVVDYDDEYQQDDVHNNSEDPLVSAMLLLAKSITQNFSNPTNNHLRASSNTRNQAIIQGDRVNIQSRNSGNTERNSRRAYVQKEVVEGMNAPKETGNVQRTFPNIHSYRAILQLFNATTSVEKDISKNCPKPSVRDSSISEPNDVEIEELEMQTYANGLKFNQLINFIDDGGQSYESAFISEVQSSSIDENNEPMEMVNSGSVEENTHVSSTLCAVEKLARNAYQEAEKQQIFAQQVQKQNTHLTSQLEMYKERVRILENINKDNNYLNEFLEADERVKRYNKQAQS